MRSSASSPEIWWTGGEPEAYAALRKRLGSFRFKTFLMIGNHDNRENFVRSFPDVARDANGFVQSVHEASGRVFIFLDTFKGETSAGAYCEKRRGWLSAALQAADGREVFLFMHHPPFEYRDTLHGPESNLRNPRSSTGSSPAIPQSSTCSSDTCTGPMERHVARYSLLRRCHR